MGDKFIARTGLIDLTGKEGFKPMCEIYGKDSESKLAERHRMTADLCRRVQLGTQVCGDV